MGRDLFADIPRAAFIATEFDGHLEVAGVLNRERLEVVTAREQDEGREDDYSRHVHMESHPDRDHVAREERLGMHASSPRRRWCPHARVFHMRATSFELRSMGP